MRISEAKDKSLQKVTINESLRITAPSRWLKGEVIEANTFPNPKYEECLKYHRYTNGVPSEIETYQLLGNDVLVNRGYCRDFFHLLKENNVEYKIEECRSCPEVLYPSMKGISLRPYQTRVLNSVSKHSQGVIVAPTGSGKTIMGLELIRIKQTPALILVHKKELATQWKKEIERLFGFTPACIEAGKFEVGERITVAMVQTMAKREKLCKEFGIKWGLVLCDECHHAPAETFAKVLNWMPSKYRYGLSATPTRRDGLDCLIARVIGPEIARVSRDEVEAVGSVIPAKITIVNTGFNPGITNNWHEFASALNNPGRNLFVISLIPENKSTLVLVDRIIHAESLSAMLTRREIPHVLAHGNLPPEERASLMQRIKSSSITIGTTGLLGEGLDVAHWDTLILAAPVSSEAKLLQAIGRIVRPAQDKELGVVYDLKDDCGFSGHSLKKRLEIYKKHRINFDFNTDFQNARCD